MDSDIIDKLKNFDLSTKEDVGVTLSNDDICLGIKECSRSLIGKIHGDKRINFNGLKETLSHIWRTQQPFTVRLVGYNIFQFAFQSEEDKQKVLLGKTWSFDGQYTILKEWTANHINWQNEAKVDLWVQIHGLPLHWISVDTGLKIGKIFDDVKDVYVPDSGSITGRWIIILAQINLNEPLLRGTKIKLGDELICVDFRYKNLQSFCYYCGIVGHGERDCTQKKEDVK
ncbi:Unknown protein [Striga hermonthica]|uniref:CCHC-type domain-containing protein n=1 Tax=Striga hermonthica TaxID=68872 RepID=A0A9N7MEK3_STRHE|nr:Unknown protein [Striga hermonthica]